MGARTRRISVRLSDDRLERLQKLCRDSGSDISHLVRQALDVLLTSDLDSGSNGATPKRVSPPEQIISLTTKYRAWGRGDVRVELKRQFAELLAASFACKQLYPRTTGMLEGYDGLLQLCRFFGMD